MQLFQDDTHVGSVSSQAKNTCVIKVGRADLYHLLHFHCVLSEDGVIESLRYQALASGVLMALAAWVCVSLEGQCYQQIQSINADTLINTFALEEPDYQHAFLLEEALTRLHQQVETMNLNYQGKVLSL